MAGEEKHCCARGSCNPYNEYVEADLNKVAYISPTELEDMRREQALERQLEAQRGEH